MDVHCTTCGEPWKFFIFGTSHFRNRLSWEEAKAWRSLPRNRKLSPRYRAGIPAAGWEFGQGVINVTRCPAVPTTPTRRGALQTRRG